MQPFTIKSFYTLLLAAISYYATYMLFHSFNGFIWIVIRSSVFMVIFITGTIGLRLSPDILPVLQTIKRRLRLIN